MVLHAAFGGSTNLLLHIPAIAHAAGLRHPTVAEWTARQSQHPSFGRRSTERAAEPSHRAGLSGGGSSGSHTAFAARRPTKHRCAHCFGRNARHRCSTGGNNPSDESGFDRDYENSTGSMLMMSSCRPIVRDRVDSLRRFASRTGISHPRIGGQEHFDRSIGGRRGWRVSYSWACPRLCYGTRCRSPQSSAEMNEGDVIALICRGPMGAGMEETYQITSALKTWIRQTVAVITDARFSGVSTGACIGHVSPEALAGGPVGKLRDGDVLEIVVDRAELEGHVNFIGEGGEIFDAEEGYRRLSKRAFRTDLRSDPALPEDTRLWAVLQQASGGIWVDASIRGGDRDEGQGSDELAPGLGLWQSSHGAGGDATIDQQSLSGDIATGFCCQEYDSSI